MNKIFFILILCMSFFGKNSTALSFYKKAPFDISLFSSFHEAFLKTEPKRSIFPQIKFFYGKRGRDWLWVSNKEKDSCLSCDERSVFKIHLQVNKKYCIDFMKDLAIEILKSDGLFGELELIYQYKITSSFNISSKRKGTPISVFYLPNKSVDFLANEKNRYEFLNGYVKAFVLFSERWCTSKKIDVKDVAFPVKPKFNLRINPIVYISAGHRNSKKDGDTKYPLIKGKTFYEGFEYTFDSRILEEKNMKD